MTKTTPTIYVVDDDPSVSSALSLLLTSAGYQVRSFLSAQQFLDYKSSWEESACLISDVKMPGLDGLELQERMISMDYCMPIIFISGHSTIPLSVQAMKLGAVNFLCKPFDDSELLTSVEEALLQAAETQDLISARKHLESLTTREHEVMRHLIKGFRNKQIAYELDISERTIKAHRKQILLKLHIESIAELVRLTEKAGVAPAETSEK